MITRRCFVFHRPLSRKITASSRRCSSPSTNDTLPEPRTTHPTLSTTASQPFTTPLQPPLPSKSPISKSPIPVSSCKAGTPLRGLNYLQGRDDPVALPEEEYPPWLWRCLDKPKDVEGEGEDGGDEFSKSLKTRRKAAKQRKKLQERRMLESDTSESGVKVPLQRQSVDLPNTARESVDARGNLQKAMRKERKAAVKEANYLTNL